jgi:hypothetical protein
MSEIRYVPKEVLDKLKDCFCDLEELMDFVVQLEVIGEEISFIAKLKERLDDEDHYKSCMGQVGVFTLFCRDYFDVLVQLVKMIEWKLMTEDEFNNTGKDE